VDARSKSKEKDEDRDHRCQTLKERARVPVTWEVFVHNYDLAQNVRHLRDHIGFLFFKAISSVMLEAIRKKQEEKEAKRLAEQKLQQGDQPSDGRCVLFRTTVKGKGGFVGEETTFSDGTTAMKVITPSSLDEQMRAANNNNNASANEPSSAFASRAIVRARLGTQHPVVSVPSTVLSAGK
jgi:hypothetical protein